MKSTIKTTKYFAALSLAGLYALGNVQAATVFFDNFASPNAPQTGTWQSWADRDPLIGDDWRLGGGGDRGVFTTPFGGYADTSTTTTGSNAGTGSFSIWGLYAEGQVLRSGDVLTLSYTAFSPTYHSLSGTWAGIDLIVDGTEKRIFTGIEWGGNWHAVGVNMSNPLTDAVTNSSINTGNVDIFLSYEYDTGKVSFGARLPGPGGASFSYVGHTEAGIPFDSIRINTGSNTDMAISNVRVVIIPEPASAALLGLGLLGFACRRRRA